jgi:hypothetical protein
MAIDPSTDYFVILKRQLRGKITLWSYEISRRSKPLGVRLQEGVTVNTRVSAAMPNRPASARNDVTTLAESTRP